jgi:predicted GIY-YIG superfamily endonuclease
MTTLYAIHYAYEGEYTFEGVTDNFELWLKEHNEGRIEQGEIPEYAKDFEVTEIAIQKFME